MIPNHSSYKCEWFEKSKKRIGKYEDYYLWLNASNQVELTNSTTTPLPPNNWVNNVINLILEYILYLFYKFNIVLITSSILFLT